MTAPARGRTVRRKRDLCDQVCGPQRRDPTTDSLAIPETADDSATALACYRHPDRETYVRCGRCERPICARCAMEGPVGLRCRDCGRPGPDPLTALTPTQLGAGLAVGLGAGTIGGFVGLQTGFFLSLCLGPFIGGAISEAVIRSTGYKRGPIMKALVLGGIVAGVVLAAFLEYAVIWPDALPTLWQGEAAAAFIRVTGAGSLIYIAAASFGALTRLR